MNITDILNMKQEALAEAPEQAQLLRTINSINIMETVRSSSAFAVPISYQSEVTKKRAMTVGSAFTIALRLLISLTYAAFTTYDFLRDSIFIKKQKEMEAATELLNSFSFDTSGNLLSDTIKKISDLKRVGRMGVSANLLADVASYAVTLSWFSAFYKSGFLPTDLSIMSTNSEVHIALVNEVSMLLNSAYNNFVIPKLLDGPLHNVVLYPLFESQLLKVTCEADIIIDGILYDVKTTADMSKPHAKDIKQLVGCWVLNDVVEFGVNNPYGIEAVGLYYPRFNIIIEGSEQALKLADDEQLF